MMTLIEELIEICEHSARGTLSELHHKTCTGHIGRVTADAAERIRDLKAENAALTKRVAELEVVK